MAGTLGRRRRGGARSAQRSPSRRRRRPVAPDPRLRGQSPRRPRRRGTRRTVPGSPGRRGSAEGAAPPPVGAHAADLALDEARDEVALRLDEGDDLRPDPECRRGQRGRRARPGGRSRAARCRCRRSAARTSRRPTATLKLWFVIPPPSGSTELDAAGPDPLDDLVDHPRTRSPCGSKSGSAATSPATHSPKISTSTGCPGCACSRGQVGVGDRALDRVAVAAARDAADRLAARRAPARSRARPRAGRRARGSRAGAPAPARPSSASRPMNSPLSSLTAKPSPAS